MLASDLPNCSGECALALLACSKSVAWQHALSKLLAVENPRSRLGLVQFNVTLASCKKPG